MSDRDYEVVVFGATGFTGALTAEYLAGLPPGTVGRWRAATGQARGPARAPRCDRPAL